MKKLKSRHFTISLDDNEEFITAIKHPSGKPVSNFILPPKIFGKGGIPDACRLGAVRIGYKIAGMRDWQFCETACSPSTLKSWRNKKQSEECSCISSQEDSGKIKPPAITKKYSVSKSKSGFEWKILIENPNNYDIEIGEVSIPIPFNNSVRNLKVGQMYAERTVIHPFIAGHSSYVLVQRLDGVPPYLLMVPDDNTPIECLAQPGAKEFDRFRLAGGGIKRLHIHSLASKESLGWKSWFHGHSETILKAKGRLKFGFVFHWVNSFEEIEKTLYDLGKVTFRVIPGMVLPQNIRADIFVKTRKEIRKVVSDCLTLFRKRKNQYTLRSFKKGLIKIKIQYGKNEWTALVFNSKPPLETLIKKRADFIVKNQQVNDKKNERYGAFMMWDADEKEMVFKAPAPYFYGCSDELGFADPLFLAAKNTRYPRKEEINALEKYIDEFLFGKIQDKRTYGVSLWYGNETWRHYRGSDKVRSFNYPHVFNIYYSMYLIGKYYGLIKSRTLIEYLKMAYKTAVAFYSLKMIAGDSYTIGNMGASMLLKLLDALEQERMLKERNELFILMSKSAEILVKAKYPYGSEFSYDTTGLETVYFFRKYLAKKHNKAEETLRCALALRHRHPLWCQSGNDVRCGMGNGKSGERGWDEICFSYMAPLNGWAILDAFMEKGDPRLIETGYAGIFGCWSLVDPDGTGHNLYTHEPDGMFMDAWTSEMGLALFASFESMATYVLCDPDFGIIGYGCEIAERDDKTIVLSKKWAASKIIDAINRISISTPNGIIKKMVTNKDGKIRLSIVPVLKEQNGIYVKISQFDGKMMSIICPNKKSFSAEGTTSLQIAPASGRLTIDIR